MSSSARQNRAGRRTSPDLSRRCEQRLPTPCCSDTPSRLQRSVCQVIYAVRCKMKLEHTRRLIHLPRNQLLSPRLRKHCSRTLQSLRPPRKPHKHRIYQTKLLFPLFQLFRLGQCWRWLVSLLLVTATVSGDVRGDRHLYISRTGTISVDGGLLFFLGLGLKRFEFGTEDVEEFVECTVDFGVVIVDFEDLGVGEVQEEAGKTAWIGIWSRLPKDWWMVSHLLGMASMPLRRRLRASSVLPTLWVQTYAMYLPERVSFFTAYL